MLQTMMLNSDIVRSQEWIPFVTQQVSYINMDFFFLVKITISLQQRLRNLIQIFGYNLCADRECTTNTSFYFTLHLSSMCAPLYTSEKICSRNPQWTKIDICSTIGSAKGTYWA